MEMYTFNFLTLKSQEVKSILERVWKLIPQKSVGLFHRALLLSGSALCWWASSPPPSPPPPPLTSSIKVGVDSKSRGNFWEACSPAQLSDPPIHSIDWLPQVSSGFFHYQCVSIYQVKKRWEGDGSPRGALFMAPRWRIHFNHIQSHPFIPFSFVLAIELFVMLYRSLCYAQARLNENQWTSGRQGEQMEQTSIKLKDFPKAQIMHYLVFVNTIWSKVSSLSWK